MIWSAPEASAGRWKFCGCWTNLGRSSPWISTRSGTLPPASAVVSACAVSVVLPTSVSLTWMSGWALHVVVDIRLLVDPAERPELEGLSVPATSGRGARRAGGDHRERGCGEHRERWTGAEFHGGVPPVRTRDRCGRRVRKFRETLHMRSLSLPTWRTRYNVKSPLGRPHQRQGTIRNFRSTGQRLRVDSRSTIRGLGHDHPGRHGCGARLDPLHQQRADRVRHLVVPGLDGRERREP